VNARLLRALVGANDQLRAAYLSTDDPELRTDILAVTKYVNGLVGRVARGPSVVAEDAALIDQRFDVGGES
jgi:hypothetical protein